jgi:tRNA (cytidine/uridine-2'-O-)-methyltransferase
MRICLFEPDIPQNAGTVMRLCACMDVPLDIVEPCGFVLSDKNLKRAGMDYIGHLDMTRHMNWETFCKTPGRRVLLTTKTDSSYLDFAFHPDDILIAGRESAGVPEYVRESCPAAVCIPMAAGLRSLNVAIATGMVLGEALRQTRFSPKTAIL